jgi:hypothetical protein
MEYKINYRAVSVSDSNVDNSTVQPLSNILTNIKNNISPDDKYALNLSENYLTDISIKELINFLSTFGGITKLNLSNNKLTENSFDDLKTILNTCKYIKINVSNNNITLRKFRNYFGTNDNIIYKI